MRVIINLYWHQHTSVRWEGEASRDFKVERGERQGCIISPLLFNLHSEFMIREAMEGMEWVKIGGKNLTDLRYADDAVLVADRMWRMQKMMDRLRETCNVYGMEINIKKTKVMIVGDREETRGGAWYSVGWSALGTGVSFQISRQLDYRERMMWGGYKSKSGNGYICFLAK
jgi:hypothetical protein